MNEVRVRVVFQRLKEATHRLVSSARGRFEIPSTFDLSRPSWSRQGDLSLWHEELKLRNLQSSYYSCSPQLDTVNPVQGVDV